MKIITIFIVVAILTIAEAYLKWKEIPLRRERKRKLNDFHKEKI